METGWEEEELPPVVSMGGGMARDCTSFWLCLAQLGTSCLTFPPTKWQNLEGIKVCPMDVIKRHILCIKSNAMCIRMGTMWLHHAKHLEHWAPPGKWCPGWQLLQRSLGLLPLLKTSEASLFPLSNCSRDVQQLLLSHTPLLNKMSF